ncbi:MAG TPA: CocE/NonD family hydrolase, partial [Thermomicrobiales bacterium]|nr:CocE/NonD family hydrolase [Thermomicrobiales bacterium]
FAPLVRNDVAPVFFDELAGAMDPACFEDYSLVGKHERVQAATYNVGGWYDIFLQDTIANFLSMESQDKPSKLLIGPWSHIAWRNPIGEINFGAGAQIQTIDLKTDFGSLQLRWFDHWLKGDDTGIMDEPPIKLFVMGANVWREETEWPLARAIPTSYFLHAEGGLSAEAPSDELPDEYEYDPRDPVPTRGGALLMQPDFMAGPFDQRSIEARQDVLVYTSEPLEQDTEVTGPIRVHLWAASSAPDTDFVARLCDVYPDGRSINLTDGIIRARYRGFADGHPASLIEPGRPYEYDIDLWATSNLFKAGHRIRLQVTSSCFPRWDRNPNTGHAFGADAELAVARQRVFHDRDRPSRLFLPVVR